MKATVRNLLAFAVVLWAGVVAGADPNLKLVSEPGKIVLVADVPAGSVADVKTIGSPPSFTVVIAVYDGKKISIATIPVTIGSGLPHPPPDNPLTGFALTFSGWVNELVPADCRVASAQRLAASCDSLVASIGAGAVKTVPEVLAASKEGNQRALGADYDKWNAVREKLRVYCNDLQKAGKLNTIDDCKNLFADMAKGLKAVK